MPYPDNFSSAAYDAAQGCDDDDDYVAEDCYAAAADFLHALDRGWLKLDQTGSAFVSALRQAVAAEREARAADEDARRMALARLATAHASREAA